MPRGILRSEAEEKHSEEKGNGRADAELKKQQEPGQCPEGFYAAKRRKSTLRRRAMGGRMRN